MTAKPKTLYDPGVMHGSLIRHVDPWQDAARGARYEAGLAADRLPRLCALAKVVEPLRVAISFAFAPANRGAVQVELSVNGRIEMDCQRCLEPLTVELAVHSSVWIVRDDAAARAIESSAEAIVSAPGEHLELAMLVEDEALLGMPFAPCHPPTECDIHPHAVDAMAYVREEGAVQLEDQEQTSGEYPRGDMAAGSGQVAGSDALAGLDVHEVPGLARAGDELSAVEAKRNPFAVLASLRDGGSEGEGGGAED